jgi:hypothetical protein
MPLIQHGAPSDMTRAIVESPAVLGPDDEAAAAFSVSANSRGVSLKTIQLTKDFGLFSDLFNPSYNVYFVAWAWDLSGNPVVQYPPAQLGISADGFVLTLRSQEERSFIGSGVQLFPPRKVTAGINVCINLWQSRQDVRNLGTTLSKVAQTIQSSSLNQVLSAIALATATPAAAVTLAANAMLELTSAIGEVLKTSADQQLDLFQGTYDVTQPWAAGDDRYRGQGTEIVLTRLAA